MENSANLIVPTDFETPVFKDSGQQQFSPYNNTLTQDNRPEIHYETLQSFNSETQVSLFT